MMTLENTIDADTEALDTVAGSFHNIAVVYKAFGSTLPFRWEVRRTDPPQHLGTIQLTAQQACQQNAERRVILRREFLRILKDAGYDR